MNILENPKQIIVVLIGIVLVVAISGFIISMSTQATGQFTYAGGSNVAYSGGFIQYSYPQEPCEYIPCANNKHATFIQTIGGTSPWQTQAQSVLCYCPENPQKVFTVPMVQQIPSQGVYIN